MRSWKGPVDEVYVLTKAGLSRPRGRWIPAGRPEQLRAAVDGSLQALDVDRLFLLQLHARDPPSATRNSQLNNDMTRKLWAYGWHWRLVRQ